MIAFLNEDDVEQNLLELLRGLNYEILHGPDISPDGEHPERADWDVVLLEDRLRAALTRINAKIPAEAIEDAIRKLQRTESPSLTENNREFHKFLTDGVPVEYRNNEGRIAHDQVWLVDADNPDNNDWVAVNQFTVIEDRHNRRPDVVIFVNGLPLAVIELKNPGDENATIHSAFKQLQTYKNEIPSLFIYNELLVVSDGIEARCGTLTSDWEWFVPWRTIDGEEIAPRGMLELDVLARGMVEKARFLDLARNFVVFEDDGATVAKKMAGYHQYHAANKAVECTVAATSSEGDKRVGVVWHTQGSGKSLTMAFYAGKIIQQAEMQNPTVVVITDRNDLDDQLFGTFAGCKSLLRQDPVQIESREELQKRLRVSSGGVFFATIQKFFPENKGEEFPLLSPRRNIVVIADEAHRSQYGFVEGFARHIREALPDASFIGFTATPIALQARVTTSVFGDVIDTYDIQRGVEDGTTVRIYYEGRLAKIQLDEAQRPKIDPEFEEVTEDEEDSAREDLKTKWSRLEKLVGAEKRIQLIAEDLVEHFEHRVEAMDGKAMVVCMSRRICVDLYNAVAKLRPEWHHEDDDKGQMKVVMTGSATDPADWQQHIRNKQRREDLANRFKDSDDPFGLVFVRDMWLTGFDAPCLHTMYVDKPMRGHGLMQAIARVNRVFRDKPGGLVVDYLGLAAELKKALTAYTEGDRHEVGIDQEQAVATLQEHYEVIKAMFNGFDYSRALTGTKAEKLALILPAMDHILALDNGRERLIRAVTQLSSAFALAVPRPEAIAIRDEVAFFQAVKAQLIKHTIEGKGKAEEELETAIQQLVSRAVAAEGIVDIFAAAGLKTPDISILSEEFLQEVRGMPFKNAALEMLRKLLNDEIKTRARKNIVQARTFAEKLEESIRKYQNRAIEAAVVIEELIGLAKEMREAESRGQHLGLSEDELAFYDALETNDSAVSVLGDETLRAIAQELVETVRRNISIDWTVRETVRAKLRTMVKRVLRKHGYPPDKREKATLLVLEQAEVICKDWAA